MNRKRPWTKRIWFYKPDWMYKPYFKIYQFWWRLWFFGDEEFHWKTICIGFPWTGQVVIALKPFDVAECEEDCYTYSHIEDYPGWPIEAEYWGRMTDEERARVLRYL